MKNVALAAGGLIGAEYLGRAVAPMIPGPGWVPSAALAAVGLMLGSQGGIVGKLGYGMGVSGTLHLIGNFVPAVDVDFGAF